MVNPAAGPATPVILLGVPRTDERVATYDSDGGAPRRLFLRRQAAPPSPQLGRRAGRPVPLLRPVPGRRRGLRLLRPRPPHLILWSAVHDPRERGRGTKSATPALNESFKTWQSSAIQHPSVRYGRSGHGGWVLAHRGSRDPSALFTACLPARAMFAGLGMWDV